MLNFKLSKFRNFVYYPSVHKGIKLKDYIFDHVIYFDVSIETCNRYLNR